MTLAAGRSAANGYRQIYAIIEDVLELLRKTAERTNPKRKNSFEIVDVEPIRGWA